MSVINLTNTYLHLAEKEGLITQIEVTPEFWPTIDQRAELQHGRLMCQLDFEGGWNSWEIHPHGDELVFITKGDATLILDRDGKHEPIAATAGQCIVVPQNTWHTADANAAWSAVFITPGKGTFNRPR